MTVSLIITTYNRLHLLKNTLAVLPRQTRPPDELLIVDDGSVDGTWAWLQQYAAKAPCPPRLFRLDRDHSQSAYTGGWLNPAIPINVGLRHAEEDIVVVGQAESIFEADAIRKLVVRVQSGIYIVTPGLYYMLAPQSCAQALPLDELVRCPGLLRSRYNHLLAYPWESRPGLGCFAASRGVVFEVRGLDESWEGAGQCDFDFMYRLSNWGVERVNDNNIAVIHQWHPEHHRNYAGDPNYARNERKALRRKAEGTIYVNGEDWGLYGQA